MAASSSLTLFEVTLFHFWPLANARLQTPNIKAHASGYYLGSTSNLKLDAENVFFVVL